MSNPVTQSLAGGIERVFNLAETFIDACPDEVWGSKFGGWPVWQQLYHGFSSISFFIRQNGDPEAPAPYSADVGGLKEVAEFVAAKAEVKAFAQKMQNAARGYMQTLSDQTLGAKNEGMSARTGKEMSHAATLSLIAGHLYYHLGSCDAAMRQHGYKGVF